MSEYSVLIGGKAGDGISQAGQLIGAVFASLGYHVYQYIDYPSLIRGGHNFCIIRAADYPVTAFRKNIDIILAFDQQTVDLHSDRLSDNGLIIFDSDKVKGKGTGIPLKSLIERGKGIPVMGNTAMTGALCRALGLEWGHVETVMSVKISKMTEKNLFIAKEAFDLVSPIREIQKSKGTVRPFFSGNEWIGLGLLAGGLEAYFAYPMTPSSGLLHFHYRRNNSERFLICELILYLSFFSSLPELIPE